VVAGKKRMLYLTEYIEAYLGDNYVGAKQIEETSSVLQKVQKKLEEHNKTLIVLLAPGKGTFYPEYFPGKYSHRQKKVNNYETFAKELKEKRINVIDMNSWFLSMKGKTPHPLYIELGVHWSAYGASLAYDSLLKYIEQEYRSSGLFNHVHNLRFASNS
jgi:hypothetical protein